MGPASIRRRFAGSVTGRGARSTSSPARARLVEAPAADLDRRHHRRDLLDLALEVAGGGPDVGERDRGHVVAGRDLAGRVERGGLDAQHQLADVGLGQRGEEAQQAGRPGRRRAAAHRWRTGRACRSGRPCGCAAAAGAAPPRRGRSSPAGLSTTARPSGPPAPRGSAVVIAPRHRAAARVELARAAPRPAGLPAPRCRAGRPAPACGADGPGGRSPAGAAPGTRPAPRATSASPSGPAREEKKTTPWLQLGGDLDRGDAHPLEAGVVDALQLVGHDLADQLVDPRRAGVVPGAAANVAVSPCQRTPFSPSPATSDRSPSPRARGTTRRSAPPRR